MGSAAAHRQANRLTLLAFILVTIGQLWVLSAGWMTYWPQYTTHYNRLAEAFRHGQCSLLYKPDPAHLALPDPYDPEANALYRHRTGVHDTVLYNGKFYLYWGPVPALLLMPVKAAMGPSVIGDQYLVFAFTFGMTVFSTLLLRSLWGRFFSTIPPWMLFLAIITAGLSTPLPYTLARSAVYEAAIVGGQCFLLGGLYLACGGAGFPGRIRLALAGTCWALAAGSRVSLAVALAGLSLLVVWRVVRHGWQQSRRFDWQSLAAFAAPLAAGAILLGAYNVARFGNWHEFGQRYQLTNNQNYHNIQRLFQPANAVPGMYSYFLRPIAYHQEFPFVEAKPGDGLFPAFISIPEHYEFNEPIAGLLKVTPFVWLALMPMAMLLRGLIGTGSRRFQDASVPMGKHTRVPMAPIQRDSGHETASQPDISGPQVETRLLPWIICCLIAASVLGFAPIPFMLGSTMRYLCDLTPCLMVLTAIGFWQSDGIFGSALCRQVFRTMVCLLSAWSITIGMLLGVTGYYQHFFHFHRHLFGHISYWAQEFGE